MSDGKETEKRDKHASSLAVERAADVLLLLASRKDAAISELAAEIGAGGGAVHRIVTSLLNKGMVAQDPVTERYSLSWSSLALARARGGGQDIRHVALPVMTDLRDQSGETVTLSIRQDDQLVCIEQIDSRQELRWAGEVGRIEVLYAGAAGKMLLAAFTRGELASYLSRTPLTPLTPLTITDPVHLAEEIAAIRASGVAVGEGERAVGIFGLAAPIYDATGAMAAVISLGAPSLRMTPERVQDCRKLIVQATHQVSRELGYRWLETGSAK